MTQYDIPPWRCILGFHRWTPWRYTTRSYVRRSCERPGCGLIQSRWSG